MSKERARARAERERVATARAAEQAAADARATRNRQRREQRSHAWRSRRLWSHGSGFRRNREAWGLFLTICALCLLVAYLLTRSVADVLGTALILLIVAPVLWALIHDRSRK